MTEYLDYLKRGELIAERARINTELNMLKVKKEDGLSTEDLQTVKLELANVLKAADERLKAQKDETQLANGGGAPEQPLANVPISGDVMIQSMAKNAKIQQIMDTVRSTEKLRTGDSIETFVCGLSQLYNIEVKPQLGIMPNLEADFVNAAKGLLTYPMFNQLEKSGKTINNWPTLKEYLISAHGSRISNFQYLHRLWNCQIQESEKFTDFGARLEEQIHHASMHIQSSFKKNHSGADMTAGDVFNLVGAMLSALQIKATNQDAYKSLIKTIDKNWTASSLLSDAADFADKMQSGDTGATISNIAFHANVMKKADKKKKSVDKKPSTQKSPSKKSNDRLENYKLKCSTQICEAFLKNQCKYGDRCFRIHPEQKSHYTDLAEPEVEPEVESEADGIKNLFH